MSAASRLGNNERRDNMFEIARRRRNADLMGALLDEWRLFDAALAPQATWPTTDVVEDDAGYKLSVEVPGFKKDEVEVSVENGVLTVSGKNSTDEADAKGTWLRRERRTTREFCRSFDLSGAGVDAAAVTAKHENGILTVTVPKKSLPEAKATKVPIR